MRISDGGLFELAAIVAVAGLAPGAASAAASAEAPAVVQSITQCREIADEAARFACYDRVAAAIGKGEAAVSQAAKPPTVETRREESRRNFGKPATPPPVAKSAEPPKAKRAEAPKPPKTSVDRVTATLEHISRTSDGRLLIVTASDGAWMQTDHEPFQNLPKAGADIVIRRAPLGNFLCDLDKWHAARCRRVD